MAEDPRKFTVKNCAGTNNTISRASQERKDFFSALGKIGDIEVLNRFGDGKITQGLRTLAKTSNSIRTGNTNSSVIPNGSGYVLDAVGINPNAAQQAGKFNPGVLNRGVAQAESILDSVKGGNFTLDSIPNVITDIQNLGSLVDGIFTDNTGQSSTRSLEVCGATPYAIDLIQYAPKYKFLFVVQVTLKEAYRNSFGESEKKLAFVVKTSTRPNVNVEHEEINMYNFWTRVPKRVIYEPITMRFYDDNKGLAHLFYTKYLESISPISRQGGLENSGQLSIEWLQQNSMNFNNTSTQSTASLTALEGDNTSIIDEIKLFHIYDYGRLLNVYHFHHPKLLTLNLDDLDMAETGGGSEIEFQFVYDAFHITPALKVDTFSESLTTFTGGTSVGRYPIKPNFNGAEPTATPEGTDADGNTLKTQSVNVLQSVTGAINSGTGLVSSAFDSAAAFGGSLFN